MNLLRLMETRDRREATRYDLVLRLKDGELGEAFAKIAWIASDQAAAIGGERTDEEIGNGTPGESNPNKGEKMSPSYAGTPPTG